MPRWQYPDLTEPVAVIEAPPTVDLGWLGQLPGPTFVKRIVHTEPDLAFEDALHRFFGVSWLPLYPEPRAKPHPTPTEPEFTFVDELHRPFGLAWLGQLPDPLRPPKPKMYTQPDMVFEDTLFRFFGLAWLPVYPEPQPKPPVTNTEPDFSFEDALHRPFDIAWWQQGLDPLRAISRLEPGVVTQPFVEEITLDKWWRQALDPVRFPRGVIAPELAAVFDPQLLPVTWGWLLQHPEPLRVLRALQLQQAPIFEIPAVPAIVFDWWQQAFNPTQRTARRDGGLTAMPLSVPIPEPLAWALAFEQVRAGIVRLYQGRAEPPTVPPPVLLGWLVQHVGQLRRPPDGRQHLQAVMPHQIIVPFSWLPYLPDPTRPLAQPLGPQPHTPWAETMYPDLMRWWQQQFNPTLAARPRLWHPVDLLYIPPVFLDWWLENFNPTLAAPPRLWTPIELPWDETLFPLLLDKWFQQQYNPTLALPPRQWDLADVKFDESIFPVPPLVWQPQQYNPTLPLPPHQYLYVFVHFPLGYPGVPCVFNPCQYLWQIIYPEDWESCVLPSGFVDVPDPTADPSGYMSSPLVRTPSGFVAAVEAVLPSGYISPYVQVPTPSGVMTWDQICTVLGIGAPSGYMQPIFVPMPSGYLKRDPHQTPRGPKSPLWDLN